MSKAQRESREGKGSARLRHDDREGDHAPSQKKFESPSFDKLRAHDKDFKVYHKWLAFFKPRSVLGFDKIPRDCVPTMSGKCRALSLCFEKLQGWTLPLQLLHDIDHAYDLTLQLSLSLFHIKSKTFFGSTWMGSPIPLSESQIDVISNAIDVDYNEVLYIMSRLTDPSCVAVVEVVVSKIEKRSQVLVEQHGCGWTILTLFALNIHDISSGYHSSEALMSTMYTGSPRDLFMHTTAEIESHLHELKGCCLCFRVFRCDKLLKLRHLVAENEVISRFEVVAGLAPKTVTLPGELRPRQLSCIGDKEDVDPKKGFHLAPNMPRILSPLMLRVIDWQLRIPNRAAYESRVRLQVTKHIHPTDASKSNILTRRLKICLHSGHTIISNNGDWLYFDLVEDEDEDVLLTPDEAQTISIPGYFAHENVAIIQMIEYEVGVPIDTETQYNSHSTMITAFREGNMQVAKVLLGCAAHIPYHDGQFDLINSPFIDEDAIRDKDNDELSIQLRMTTDDLCQILSQNLIFRDDYQVGDSRRTVENRDKAEDITDDQHVVEMAFDLKVFGGKVEYVHGDSYDPEFVDDDIHHIEPGDPIRPSRVRPDRDDTRSVAELSLVEGNSDISSLRLDHGFYDEHDGTTPRLLPRSNLPVDLRAGTSSLLAKSLKARLSSAHRPSHEPDDIIEPTTRFQPESFSASLRESIVRKAPIVTQSRDDPGVRELSRGARSRLGRHGFTEVPLDSVAGKTLIRTERQATAPMESQRLYRRDELHDIEQLADDELSINEINVQFAGYKAYFPCDSDTKDRSSLGGPKSRAGSYVPRCIYFSYQFYTCEPTRTEIMRLVPNSDGKDHFVLVRDEVEYSRKEIPLVIRHVVNCDSVSTLEAYEFAKYLTRGTLYIDVWDADSLLHLGTMPVPLRALCRGGETRCGCTLECDVSHSRSSGNDAGGAHTTVVCNGRAPVGDCVGSVHIVLSNTGHAGKNTKESRLESRKSKLVSSCEGLNWRAHSGIRGSSANSHRPKNSVRARPLAENAPTLSRALDDFRNSGESKRGSMRSLSAVRGAEDVHTITYDDVIILFKRFQGSVKGSVQYEGPMMKLLDIPSWSLAVRKLIKVFKKVKISGHDIKLMMMRYADHAGNLALSDFQECLIDLFGRYGVLSRKEEVAIIAAKVAAMDQTRDQIFIRPDDFARFCTTEADRQDWTMASSRIKRAVQKALLAGIDVEQMLADRDTKGHHTLSVEDFKLFWKDMQRFGKISPRDVFVVVDHFTKRDSQAGNATVVSIPEVASFLGIKYVGNVQVRLRNIICPATARSSSSPEWIMSPGALGVLAGLKGSKPPTKDVLGEKCRNVLPYEEMERRLEEFNVYSVLGHEQLRKILISARDAAGRSNNNGLSVMDLLNYLKIDTSGLVVPQVSQLGAEELLKLLLARASQDGAAIDQAFRHFDADGDGTITEAELLRGLSDLRIFDSIPNWRQQVPAIVAKFDTSGDGAVSLNEFFTYLGAEKYLPNIMQRMTKIFASSNVPLKAIFASFDVKGAGSITAAELKSGLNEIGGFQEISEADIVSITSFFDEDGDGEISLDEFTSYFSERIKQAKRDMKDKKCQRLQRRVRDILKAVVEEGGSFEQLFRHFDKDGNGSITCEELSSGLRSIPQFKTLSDAEIKDLTQVLDADNNNSISMEEFKQFATDSAPTIGKGRGLTRLDSFSLRSRPIIERLHEIVKTAMTKGKSADEIFSHLDANRDGTLTCDELRIGLKKIPFFSNIDDGDFVELFRGIDLDGSGEVDVAEFIDCVVNCKQPTSDVTKDSSQITSDGTPLDRFRAVIIKAIEKGASMDDIFARLDSNKDGSVTLSELRRELKKIPFFSGFRDSDFTELYRKLDADDSGEIKISEFVDLVSPRRHAAVPTGHQPEPYDAKNVFIRSLNNLDEYNGIRGICAFLDNDEDGLIEYAALIRFLRREGVLESRSGLTEGHVDDMLSGMLRKDDSIRVQNLLQFVENGGEYLDIDEMQSDSDDDFDRNEPDYEFSNDPQTRSLEKKLRHVGRTVCKRGIDIETLFKSYDTRYSGMIRRTEFLEVLSKLGLYILEQRPSSAADSKGAIDGDEDIRRSQQRQLSRLRRSGPERASSAAAKHLGGRNDGDFKDHLESMALIDWYRQGQKKMLLQRILSHSLASTIYLYPRFGRTSFFEYALSNPFGHEERFLIEVNDFELKVVSSFDEWLHLRTFCKSCSGDIGEEPVEADMFDVDGAGNVQVSLLPQETLHIPFTLLTLRPGAVTAKEPPRFKGRDSQRKHNSHKHEQKSVNDREIDTPTEVEDSVDRTIEVRFISASHGHVVAVLKINVCYRTGVIDRNIMFYEPENSVMNRRIQLIDDQTSSSYPGKRSYSTKYIHCVENITNSEEAAGSQVLIEWGPSEDSSNGLDMIVRYRCGSFPDVGSFYILVYDDPFQSSLYETWHVTVHSRQRLDLHCSLGSKNCVDLIVRGDRYARRGRAFSTLSYLSSSDSASFQPETFFQLVPGAYNRVVLNYCPKQLGSRHSLVNVVDVDTRELVSSWILYTTVSAPVIMRSYDVEMIAGQPLSKKIVFKNPWDISRTFYLESSDETVMRVRSPEVEVAGHGTTHLKLVFVGQVKQDADAFLFLNDKVGRNEECFVFHVRVR